MVKFSLRSSLPVVLVFALLPVALLGMDAITRNPNPLYLSIVGLMVLVAFNWHDAVSRPPKHIVLTIGSFVGLVFVGVFNLPDSVLGIVGGTVFIGVIIWLGFFARRRII